MYDNFSLELETEKIYISKTKIYFKEVLSSYNNHNFRASIVTLYSVVIIDLLYKLEYLQDLYSDDTAKRILDEIKNIQKTNPTSPEWESILIKKIKEQTNLLEIIEFENLERLQKVRHLCAHPIYDRDFQLYIPNKETVRAFIRNTLEGILIKPPLFSKRIFEELIEDLATNKDFLLLNKNLVHHQNGWVKEKNHKFVT